MIKNIVLFSLLHLSFLSVYAHENSQKIKNIVAFSKSYEMLRYLHPNSDFKSANWVNFVEMSMDSILQNDNLNVVDFLNKSFSFFQMTEFSTNVAEKHEILMLNNCNIKYYTNYHGYTEKDNSWYYSERLQTDKKNKLKSVEIATNIHMRFPTFSCDSITAVAPTTNYKTTSSKTEYLTSLIMLNAVCNQFYPDKLKIIEINTQFESYIEKLLLSDEKDLMFILSSYTTLLKDSHVSFSRIDKASSSIPSFLGIDWEITSDSTLKVKQTHPLFAELNGCEITAINNILIKDKINYYNQTVSSANPNFILDKAKDNFKMIKDTNDFTLTYVDKEGKEENLKIINHLTMMDYILWEEQYLFPKKQERINDSIIYVDLKNNPFNNSLDFLSKNSTNNDYVFLDVRGHPFKGCQPFLSSLFQMQVVDTFMNDPVMNIDTSYYTTRQWIFPLSSTNKIRYKQIFILINHNTLSVGESVAFFLSKAPNSYLVGTQSSGCNGDVTYATLDGLKFRYTGTKVDYKNNKTPMALYPYFEHEFKNNKLSMDEFLLTIKQINDTRKD